MKIKDYKKFTKGRKKIKDSWDNFINISKREIDQTGKLADLLKKALRGEKLTDSEVRYIKSQSGNIGKIIGIMAMGSVSMVIPIALNKALKKWNIDIMPKDNRHLLDKKLKEESESDK